MTPAIRRFGLALLMGAAALPALAQTAPTPSAPTPPEATMTSPIPEARVIVTGEGRADVAPDMAVMSMGVSTMAPTAAEALAANSTRVAEMLKVIKAAGVEDRDIQTSGLMLNPQFDYSKEGQPPVLTAYQAQNMVTLRMRDLTRMGGVLDAVVGAGATDFSGLTYTLQDPKPAQDAARQDAVAQARARAELYAAALGMTLGPVRVLSEQAIMAPPAPMMMREAMAYGKGAADVPLQGGELSVTASVNIEYALLP